MTKVSRPVLKQEYVQMQRNLFQRFFRAIVITLIWTPFIEFGRSVMLGDFTIFYASLIFVSIVWICWKQISNLQDYQELAITIFLWIVQGGFIVLFYNFSKTSFENSHNAFYFGTVCAHFEAAITNRIPNFQYRTGFRLTLIVLRLLTVPMLDKGELPVHFVCCAFATYMDYERERFDQRLFGSYFYSKEALNKFKDLVVNDIPESVVVLSQDTMKCLFANNPFLQLIQEDNMQIIKESLDKFMLYEVPDSKGETNSDCGHSLLNLDKQNLTKFLQNWLEEVKNVQKRTSCNLSFKKYSQADETTSERIFEAKIVPLVWDEQNAIGIILHDVTQQISIIRLKINANKQKDRMLATISHELRTPLNGILGMIQVVEQRTQDQETLKHLSVCKNSGHLLLGLVNSILDLNLIRANKFKLYKERIHLMNFLQDIVRLFEHQCQLKSIFIKLRVPSFTLKFITTDKNRLSQILINLIGNALKFTNKGGITVSAEIYIKDQDYLEISVEDTGIGIKEEDKGKLFQIFGKLENEQEGTAVNHQGVGLGLTISNNLAKLLCGNNHKNLQGIRLESVHNKGTKFSFLIKHNLDHPSSIEGNLSFDCLQSNETFDEGELENLSKTNHYKLPSMKKPHHSEKVIQLSRQPTSLTLHGDSPFTNEYVLIVDDNPLNIAVAEIFVQKHNYKVKTALHGQAAIDLMLQNDSNIQPVKLILMDLQMPLMDGYETTKALKRLIKERKIPETPIVALTANDSEDDKKHCMMVGMSDYLTKPIKDNELVRVLSCYMKK